MLKWHANLTINRSFWVLRCGVWFYSACLYSVHRALRKSTTVKINHAHLHAFVKTVTKFSVENVPSFSLAVYWNRFKSAEGGEQFSRKIYENHNTLWLYISYTVNSNFILCGVVQYVLYCTSCRLAAKYFTETLGGYFTSISNLAF